MSASISRNRHVSASLRSELMKAPLGSSGAAKASLAKGGARSSRTARFAQVSMLLVGILTTGACNLLSTPQDFGGLPIPDSLGLRDLDEATQARIFATLEIGDNVKFLEETRLEISPDFSAIRGEFNINESFLTVSH